MLLAANSSSLSSETPSTWIAITTVPPPLAVSPGVATAILTSRRVLPLSDRNVASASSPSPSGIPPGTVSPSKLPFSNATPLTSSGSIASSSPAAPGLKETSGLSGACVSAGVCVSLGCSVACAVASGPFVGALLAEPPQAETSRRAARALPSTLRSVVMWNTPRVVTVPDGTGAIVAPRAGVGPMAH